jgi:quercetin dioxygenase-like cupin family protein
MASYRMYADANQVCRLEDLDVVNIPEFNKPRAAKSIDFKAHPVGTFLDWHPAPRRQFVIIVSGQLEIGFEDGTKRVFNPGDARLVEDTVGKGHTTATYGNEPCVVATIPLQD